MYIPRAFTFDDRDELLGFVAARSAGHLVSMAGGALSADVVPWVVEPGTDGGWGSLLGHLARANPQVGPDRDGQPVLVIFPGADGYVSPTWYPSRATDGRVVPTWNYEVVQVTGTLRVHDDQDWVRRQVEALTARHEGGRAERWSVDEPPADWVVRTMPGIVGLEVEIDQVVGKRKLSQNRTDDEAAGVVRGLRADGGLDQVALADAMERPGTRPPG